MTDAIDNDTMLQGLRDVPGSVWRTYLAPDVKVMFESLNKNACTSLKWMMADLAGEDLAQFRAGGRPYINDDEAVHDRSLWRVSPKLDRLTPEERQNISPDHGWFIFAVVRDPRLRLFSAWQNKILIETPHSQRWRDEPWYPRHPLTRDTVIDDFAAFVHALDEDPAMWLRKKDPHFRDQVELLAEHAIPYSRIYEIHEMGELRKDLEDHLRAQGSAKKPVFPRTNPTPLRAIPALFDNGVREVIEQVYAADFERFGHLWDFSSVESAAPWTKTDLAACETEAALGHRIAELHQLLHTARARNSELRTLIDQLTEQISALESERASSTAPVPDNI